MKISIVTSCYNEEGNIESFYNEVRSAMSLVVDKYDWELIIADNFSTDRTREIIREIASRDRRVKYIFNANNFGVVRSSTNALYAASGDAIVTLCSDLQDPPSLIPELIKKWEEGNKVVCAIKRNYGGSFFMNTLRKLYYRILSSISEIPLIKNFHGYGLYDKAVIEAVKSYKDPYPYMRGLISEIGFTRTEVLYDQAKRKAGKSSYSIFSYYEFAINGCVNYSKFPLHIAVYLGTILAILSLFTAFGYFIYKLLYWDSFQVGSAPLIIGLFFFSAVQLIFLGLIGEYIGAIWTQVKNKPLVIEEERGNF